MQQMGTKVSSTGFADPRRSTLPFNPCAIDLVNVVSPDSPGHEKADSVSDFLLLAVLTHGLLCGHP